MLLAYINHILREVINLRVDDKRLKDRPAIEIARSLLAQGQRLFTRLRAATKSEQGLTIRAVNIWCDRFSEFVNEPGHDIPGNAKGIQGVPKSVSDLLWDMEGM